MKKPVYSTIDDGRDVYEMVSELNSRGLKTPKGCQYSYGNLRGIISRRGINPPKIKTSLSNDIKDKLREFHESGLSSKQAYGNLMKESQTSPHDSFTYQRISNYYKCLDFSKGTISKNKPIDFIGEIHALVDKGLNLSQIAEELNKRGMKTIKGKAYRDNSVRAYCNGLGLKVNRKRYLEDPKLIEQIDIAVSSGKSCKLIAEKINEMGFKTFIGRAFKPGDIRQVLARQGKKASNPCRYEYIIVEIKPFAEAGYHPRTIARKLNAKGIKTVTGGRFKTRTVEQYLRKMKAMDDTKS
ncbi:MAG: hypothetical protein GY846_02715 [Deltaproteobacteria bacterium]|nr:hypothetical protein [Deltaproteobacteria bacterium]